MQKLNLNIQKQHKASGSQSNESMSSQKMVQCHQKTMSSPSSFESQNQKQNINDIDIIQSINQIKTQNTIPIIAQQKENQKANQLQQQQPISQKLIVNYQNNLHHHDCLMNSDSVFQDFHLGLSDEENLQNELFIEQQDIVQKEESSNQSKINYYSNSNKQILQNNKQKLESNCGENEQNHSQQQNHDQQFNEITCPNTQWRLGGYSSSKSGLSNSDDKKMSDWSKQLLQLNLKKTSDKQSFIFNIQTEQNDSKGLCSPTSQNLKIKQNKVSLSPQTPEDKIIDQNSYSYINLENKCCNLIRSKSLKGSKSTQNLVSSIISSKLQNEEEEIGNRIISWANRKNAWEKEGADGPKEDHEINTPQNQVFEIASLSMNINELHIDSTLQKNASRGGSILSNSKRENQEIPIELKNVKTEQKTESTSFFNPMSIFAYMGEEFVDEKEIIENDQMLQQQEPNFKKNKFADNMKVKTLFDKIWMDQNCKNLQQQQNKQNIEINYAQCKQKQIIHQQNNFEQSGYINSQTDQNMQYLQVQNNMQIQNLKQINLKIASSQNKEVQQLLKKLNIQDHEILSKLDFYCFDQSGCRMLQQKIIGDQNTTDENGNLIIPLNILNELPEQRQAFRKCLIYFMLPILADVMINQFGNYLCQKIIEESDFQDIQMIVDHLNTQIINVSLNIHGTRVIQILIEKLSQSINENIYAQAKVLQEPQNKYEDFDKIKGFKMTESHKACHQILLKVISYLQQQAQNLIMDIHGNHVIQAFLIVFKGANHPDAEDILGSHQTGKYYTEFIFKACAQACVEIGVHKHGCCVMQRCLEKGSRAQNLFLSDFIIENIHYLIEDPFGNYLIQNVLKLQDREKNERIFKQIAKDFIRLSQLKFSSNVIEKCLDSKMSWLEKDGIKKSEPHIDKIFKGTFPEDDNEIIKEFGFQSKQSKILSKRVHFIVQKLIYNQFGNYVLQRALNVMGSDHLRKEILLTIKSLQPSLMQIKHGQKVIQKLQKTYPQIFSKHNEYDHGARQNFNKNSFTDSYSQNSIDLSSTNSGSKTSQKLSKFNNSFHKNSFNDPQSFQSGNISDGSNNQGHFLNYQNFYPTNGQKFQAPGAIKKFQPQNQYNQNVQYNLNNNFQMQQYNQGYKQKEYQEQVSQQYFHQQYQYQY